MASEHGKPSSIQQDSFTNKLTKSYEQLFLQVILENAYDSILITDGFGNVLLANAGTEKFMGYQNSKLIGNNTKDLIKKGVYDWSPSLQAIKTRNVVSGIVTNYHGDQHVATSKPVMNENGDISMIITNARDRNLVDKYRTALEIERTTVNRYKTAVEYLSSVDLEKNEPVAESSQMRHIIRTSKVIAKTDSTVMLIGETGTGKEVMARYIHRNSFRSQEPFIPVNCAAIPHELLESEFFGYVRGAFSGANPQGKPGLFEIADKGTLFLDEIAELPLAMQSKLLRVLESSEIQRLGDTNIYKVNVRFIAATNRDLKTMMSQKLFRSDLYYRLNVIPINIPPLNERPEDILAFAYKFLEELNRKYTLKKVISGQATEAFLKYNWPGNVRELRNVIERLVITTAGDTIYFEDDSLGNNKTHLESVKFVPEINKAYQWTLKSVLKAVEKEYINKVLTECDGRVGEAARRLGIHRTMLYRKNN